MIKITLNVAKDFEFDRDISSVSITVYTLLFYSVVIARFTLLQSHSYICTVVCLKD